MFGHTQQVYTPVYGSAMLVKFLLPVWGMLFVFHPIDAAQDTHHDILAQSDDGVSIYLSFFMYGCFVLIQERLWIIISFPLCCFLLVILHIEKKVFISYITFQYRGRRQNIIEPWNAVNG